jgi:hypothetical protein
MLNIDIHVINLPLENYYIVNLWGHHSSNAETIPFEDKTPWILILISATTCQSN